MSITFADVAELLREHPHYVYANLLIADFDFASAGTTPLEFCVNGGALRVRRQSAASWPPWPAHSGEEVRDLDFLGRGLGLGLLQGTPTNDPNMRRVFPVRFDAVMRRWEPAGGSFLSAMKKYLA